MGYIARLDARPSARKALEDEADMVTRHKAMAVAA
jgi:hypothetical protein